MDMSQSVATAGPADHADGPVDFEYRHAPAPVRADIAHCHRRAWRHIAGPGAWWTGAQRVAIAAEARAARRCPLCEERKQALSPYVETLAADACDGHARAEDPSDESPSALPPVVVDTVHRVVTDPGRLSRRVYDDFVASGLGPGHYVEMLGVVVTVVPVDTFHRALGVPPAPLPAPRSGRPSGYQPATTDRIGAWVPTMDYRRTVDVPDDLADTVTVFRGQPGIWQTLSLVPSELAIHMLMSDAHYLPIAQVLDLRARRALARPQMEFLAARVAAIQECFF